MNEEKIKEAFQKAKQDIIILSSQLDLLKQEILQLKQQIFPQTIQQTINPTHFPTEKTSNYSEIPAQNPQKPTIQHKKPTLDVPPTHIPAQNTPFKALKSQNLIISTGNNGVPTDRQTNQQTDNSTGNEGVKVRLSQILPVQLNKQENRIKHIEKVTEFLSSLDDIKKDLRQRVKHLTNQEMSVYASIYQLEEEGFLIDYPLLAQKLSLTESSIRDYIQRIIKKGLPLQKTKENNKKIILSVPLELKKIAPIQTILQLREL